MRLWEDGFDHYGSTEAFMLDGSYGVAGNQLSLSTAHPATGTHGLLISRALASSSLQGLRFVLPTAKDYIGAAARFYFPSLPQENNRATIFGFMTSNPLRGHIDVNVDANGCLRFYQGRANNSPSSGTLIAQSDPLIGAAAQNHIEVQMYCHDTAGWVRAAINGVHRYEATGLDTKFGTDSIVSIMNYINYDGFVLNNDFYMDDYYIYDFTGNSAVDTDFCPTVDGTGKATNYIGDLLVWPLFENGDTAEADFLKSTGTDGYPLVGKTTPNDASYIYSTTAGDLSEFDLEDLPVTITYVRGLGLHQRLSKSDGGTCTTQIGMKSVAAVSDATARVITTAPTYWWDHIDVDPNSSARWTRTSLNAAKVRITRAS
jgi:hypothetical protein